jgi:hypothetical protein
VSKSGNTESKGYKHAMPRITQLAFQKGMSVYQIKMTALRQLTGIIPSKKITYKVDTSINLNQN